jgi:hypothetical protein
MGTEEYNAQRALRLVMKELVEARRKLEVQYARSTVASLEERAKRNGHLDGLEHAIRIVRQHLIVAVETQTLIK